MGGLLEGIKPHYSRSERKAIGKSLREKCPRKLHANWKVPDNRPDTLSVIQSSEEGRMPELLPLRHGRMVQSPFTFYRAGALAMAIDLAGTPITGFHVQCCGDAHLSNFGGFATPKRQIIFSINDLDETLPAPWEWDIKRLAVSFVAACRDNGFSESVTKDIVLTCVRSYRKRMTEFSEMKTLDLWHFTLHAGMVFSLIKDDEERKAGMKSLVKARENSLAKNVFPKLIQAAGKTMLIKDQPPAIFHDKDHRPGEVDSFIAELFETYRNSLSPGYRLLLSHYHIQDIALKVSGIGSVGTKCWVLLLTAADKDPLFLQVKEARPSVLESFAGKSDCTNYGQRVVNGYRIIQPASDIFLGWTFTKRDDHHYYVRHLRDVKIKFPVETYNKAEMNFYARLCSYSLALAHARSGDAGLISSYMGRSDVFDNAVATFSFAYADQNEKDYEIFKRAVRSGRVEAVYEKGK